MRLIEAEEITSRVAELCHQANTELGEDVLAALRRARDAETSPVGQELLEQLLRNAEMAAKERLPLCQDCGLAVLFLEIGQEVQIIGGDLRKALDEGVRRGYREGYLRKSAVARPFSARINTGDNTPAIVHTEIVPGSSLKITFLPKGGGSENTSRLAMLRPADGREGVIAFVVRTVDELGASACPPLIVGVGVGGTFDYAAYLAKRALLREVGRPSVNGEDAALEEELLSRVNALGIGPMGLGGDTTALAIHVESHPCHTASLPVAVNLQCHSARHKKVVIQHGLHKDTPER